MSKLFLISIEWWAFPCLTAAEIYGTTSKMPKGGKFLDAATNTANQVWKSWNVETCGGGIFWSPNPLLDGPISNDNYKSTITNVQYIFLAAKLGRLTNDGAFVGRAQSVYQWLKAVKLITQTGKVLDGTNAPNCHRLAPREYSYNAGVLLMGLVELYRATNNAQYLDDAKLVYENSKILHTSNDIVVDSCEPSCRPQEIFHKALFVKGLSDYHSVADDGTKNGIRNLIQNSMLSMISKSCDDDWNCDNHWNEGFGKADFHSQLAAIELVNAVLSINFPGPLLQRNTVPTYGEDTFSNAFQTTFSVFLFYTTFIFLLS